MKQGETLALNERIMLSLVSTGVSIFFFFFFPPPYNIKAVTYGTHSINSVGWHTKVNPPWNLPPDCSDVSGVRMEKQRLVLHLGADRNERLG